MTGERQHMYAGHGREQLAGVMPIPPGKQPPREEHLTLPRLHCQTAHLTQVAGIACQQGLMWMGLVTANLEAVRNNPPG